MNEELMNQLIEVIWPYLDKAAEACTGGAEDWDEDIERAKGDINDAVCNALDSWSAK